MNGMTIRNALLHERELIRQFVCRAHIAKSGYNDEAIRVQTDDLPNDFPELFHENLWNPALCWICSKKSTLELPDDILGCVGIRVLDDNTIYLICLYVNTLHRRMGIGRKLLKLIIDWSRSQRNSVGGEYKAVTLYTLKGIMTSAIDLYDSEGFKIVEENTFTCFSVITMKLDLLEAV